MITATNYLSRVAGIDFTLLPPALQKGDELTRKALERGGEAYNTSETVRRVVDAYLEKLNRSVAMKPDPKADKEPWEGGTKKAAPSPAAAMKVIKQKAAAPAKKPAPAKRTPAKRVAAKKAPARRAATRKPDTAERVELMPPEVALIRRYANMHGKVRTRAQLLRLLSSLQKAMVEKRIRKTSPFATEVLQMQDQLIAALDRMKSDAAEITIAAKNLERYKEIASSRRIRESVALLKRFLSLHGKDGIKDKAVRLRDAIMRAVDKEKVKSDDPYMVRLAAARMALQRYIDGMASTPKVQNAELNGIRGLLGLGSVSGLGAAPAKAVMPSGELMRMKFETIGLRGKFRELIGDPAVGFTAMVFGQPKSGKSTLMLEFAHHLAREHGEVLYCAIEEGYGYTLQEKIARLGTVHERLNFSDRVPSDLSAYDFVFIDSVSKAGMELEDLVKLKHANPRTSFVFIFHSTKQGQFRGGNELAHEVDVIIEVEPGLVKASGRFNAGGEITIKE